jgi:hypothetical protein
MNDETARHGGSASAPNRRLSNDNESTGTSPPAIVIHFELERRPVVYSTAQHDGDFQRLRRWLDSRDPYRRLINDAIALGEEAA